jgi:phage shock protein A
MFEELRAAFRQAIENFNRELHRDQVPETMDRLLAGMQRELVDAKALVSELESQVERARREARSEAEQADVCRRREEMARRIDDTETADLAAQYAERHTKRHALLEQKVAALDEELAFRRKDAEEMLARIKEARTEREGLTATTGRTQARQSLDDADDLFSQLDRMAEKIEGERHAADAAEELGDLGLDRPSDFHVEIDGPPAEPPDVDAALAELKRRMGK